MLANVRVWFIVEAFFLIGLSSWEELRKEKLSGFHGRFLFELYCCSLWKLLIVIYWHSNDFKFILIVFEISGFSKGKNLKIQTGSVYS